MEISVERAELLKIKRNAENIIKAIEGVLDSSMDGSSFNRMSKTDKVEYIIDGVCAFYDIDRPTLLKKTSSGTVVNRRKYVTLLLFDYAHMDEGDIAVTMGYNRAIPYHHLKDLNDKLSDTVFGEHRMKATYKSIREYLKIEA